VTQAEVVALVIEALERCAISYMVTGSFASNFHGVPRMTQDVDLVIDADEPGVERFVGFLEQAFYVSRDAAREAARRRTMFNVIHFDTGFKVDLVLKKARPFSDLELTRRLGGELAGRQVSFATAEDTILSKLEWARQGDSERQFVDAANVIEVQGDDLDWAYLEQWAAELGLTRLLDKARRGAAFRA
jgi:hypothetical protein